MAIERTIKINADTKEANKDINKVSENLEGIDKSADKASGGIKNISTSTKALGTAFKALGIGLIVALVAKLTEVFSKNQKVVDFVSTSMEVLNIAFNDFFNFIFDNSGKVTGFFKDIFENPVESIKKLGQAIKDNIIERFNSMLEVFGFVSQALVKLFEGDFQGALDSIKEAGKEAVDVLTGVDGTTEKIADGINTVVEAGSKYLKQTIDQAKANVELANTSQLAAAQQARLVEQYDRLAEKQRQIRDDESISIKERQEANEKLAQILEQQEKAMLRQADLQVAAAAAQVETNNNIENRVALTEALANKEGVLAQVEGFRSEQLVNKIALQKEEIELNQSISDAEKERRLAQLEFEASQEENAVLRLEKQRERLEEENEIILEDLERKKELFAEGTQARIDAEQDYLNRKQEIDNAIVLNEKEASKEKENIAKTVEDTKVSLAENGFNLLGNLAKKGSELAKGIAIAGIVREQVKSVSDTVQSTVAANAKAAAASPLTAGQPFVAINTIQAGLGIASGISQAAKSIKSITGGGKSPVGGSVSSGGGGGAQAPSFNLVQGTGSNQIAESLQTEQEPIKAFVVSSEVTTSQSLDRNIEENASI